MSFSFFTESVLGPDGETNSNINGVHIICNGCSRTATMKDSHLEPKAILGILTTLLSEDRDWYFPFYHAKTAYCPRCKRDRR